jgi:hypothetical protein
VGRKQMSGLLAPPEQEALSEVRAQSRPRRRAPGSTHLPAPVARLFLLLLAVLVTGLGVGTGTVAVHDLAYAAGWSGNPGLYTPIECHRVGSGRNSHVDCTGLFQATNPHTQAVLAATGDGSSHRLGTALPARIDSGGEVTLTSSGTIISTLGQLLLCTFFVSIGALALVAAVRPQLVQPASRRPRGGGSRAYSSRCCSVGSC